MNKKAMEASINVIVGIILGILMLSAGIVIFKTIVTKAQDIQPIVDEHIRKQMLLAFNEGEKLFVPQTDIAAGLNDKANFYYEISNIYTEPRNFTINITAASSSEPLPKTLFWEGPFEINPKDKEILRLIAIPDNSDVDTYNMLITVKICDAGASSNCVVEYAKRIVRLHVS